MYESQCSVPDMCGCRLARQEALQLNQSIMAFPSLLDQLGPEISDPEEGKIETESPFLLHTLLHTDLPFHLH